MSASRNLTTQIVLAKLANTELMTEFFDIHNGRHWKFFILLEAAVPAVLYERKPFLILSIPEWDIPSLPVPNLPIIYSIWISRGKQDTQNKPINQYHNLNLKNYQNPP